MDDSRISTEKADISVTDEGHIHIRVHENQELDLEDVIRINAAKNDLARGKPYTVIFQAPGFGNISLRAREFSASQECYRNAIAKAIVTNTISGKLIGNFFITFHKPPAPTRVFNSVTDAARWLNSRRAETETV